MLKLSKEEKITIYIYFLELNIIQRSSNWIELVQNIKNLLPQSRIFLPQYPLPHCHTSLSNPAPAFGRLSNNRPDHHPTRPRERVLCSLLKTERMAGKNENISIISMRPASVEKCRSEVRAVYLFVCACDSLFHRILLFFFKDYYYVWDFRCFRTFLLDIFQSRMYHNWETSMNDNIKVKLLLLPFDVMQIFKSVEDVYLR